MWKWRYNVFVSWTQNRNVIWLYAWKPLILITHTAKFGGHRPCDWENLVFLNCPETTGSKCYLTLWVGTYPESGSCQVLGPRASEMWWYIVFDLSRNPVVVVSCEFHYWRSATNCDLFLVLNNIKMYFISKVSRKVCKFL